MSGRPPRDRGEAPAPRAVRQDRADPSGGSQSRRVAIIAQVAERDAIVTVRRKGAMHEVLFDGRIILTEEVHESEITFGRLAANLAAARPDPRVLVGGLGFGYTLRGALDALGPRARLVVVERVAPIVELCRGELAPLAGRPLEDPRVSVAVGSVQQVLGARTTSFDVILLDIDNGPDWATFRDNTWLYGEAGVRACAAALAPGGSLAVWSGYPAPRFLRVLRRAGLQPREVPLPVRGRVRARAYVGSVRLPRRRAKD